MLNIGDNFNYQGRKPNFARDSFDTLEEMRSYPDTSVDHGHVSFCKEDGKLYQFLTTNQVSTETGKWRRLVDSILDANSENPVQNKAIVKQLETLEQSIDKRINELGDTLGLESMGAIIAAGMVDLNRNMDELEEAVSEALNSLKASSINIEGIKINGHSLTDNVVLNKNDIGLENVDNTSDLDKPLSTRTQLALSGKVDKSTTVNGHPLVGNVDLTKSDIGLGNVDNTSDLDKPISTSTQNALDDKVSKVPGKDLVEESEIAKLKSYESYELLNKRLTSAQTTATNASNGISAVKSGLDQITPIVENLKTQGDLIDQNILGAFRPVPNIASRNNIPQSFKEIGTVVYVVDDPSEIHTYQWNGGEWIPYDFGGGIKKIDRVADLKTNKAIQAQGSVVYVKEDDAIYYKNDSNGWTCLTGQGSGIVVSAKEPEDVNALWVDTTDNQYDTNTALVYSIQKAVYELQKQVKVLMNIRSFGAVSGSITDGTRTELANTTNPLMPGYINELVKEEVLTKEQLEDIKNSAEVEPKYATAKEPTVNHISIKMGTWEQMDTGKKNFIPGELIWCTDRTKLYIFTEKGKLIPIGSGSSIGGGSSEDNNETTDMDQDTVNSLIDSKLKKVDSIGFVPVGSEEAKYTVKVNAEGKLQVYDNSLDNRQPELQSNYYYDGAVAKVGIVINSFYLGGSGSNAGDPLRGPHDYQPCSHNFVELGNPYATEDTGSGEDINLNGFYLLYMGSNKVWKKLKLWGKIPAGGTFLIRGAQCSVMDVNTTALKVKTYDMEWKEENGDLIKFDQSSAVFYLCWAPDDEHFYNIDGTQSEIPSSTTSPVDVAASNCAKGFIDLASFNNSAICEKATYILPAGRSASEVVFRRWYMLDPTTQSNPREGVGSFNNNKFLASSYISGANIGGRVEDFTPRASFEGKSIATSRTLFSTDHPSTLTCTFGIQATAGTNGATRCFCWNSVDYHDEFIWYRKKGTAGWTKVESIKPGAVYSAATTPNTSPILYGEHKSLYDRVRWESAYGQSLTTHRVIISGLQPGEYEYKVVRSKTDDSEGVYQSKVRKFTVISDAQAGTFNFLQVTDQQGASWEEYEVWNLSAKFIKKEETAGRFGKFNFVINTGDICYNGSRSNEWIDYFDGYEPFDDREEMLTIGNNDLAPISMRDLGNGKESPWKINTYVIDYFYTFEIDHRNPQVFTGPSAKDEGQQVSFKMPSLYSFNYGKFHFISLLSETRTISNKVTYDSTGKEKAKKFDKSTVNAIYGIKDELREGGKNKNASKIYDIEEEWIIKDLLTWKGVAIPSNFDFRQERFNPALVGKCNKCIVFTHEMPFNITSNSAYKNYDNNIAAPRETAKAYLNRYHNYEYQRVFKLWGIPLVMGGHKHTCAITAPVYDAPLTYNPLTKKIDGSTSSVDDILTDDPKTGMFSTVASFKPFMQLTVEGFNSRWSELSNWCDEVYNNSSTALTIDGSSVAAKSFVRGRAINNKARCRIEVVDNINAPSYVMCQATGFKNKSNSDLAGDYIPWERFYVKASNLKEQSYPFYTVYEVTDGEIKSYMYQIRGMYDAGSEKGSPAGYWDLAKIYTHGDTVKENRDYFVNSALSSNLYNTGGTIIKL